jgi:glycosyltransferase involved in cell wall biosynthesis
MLGSLRVRILIDYRPALVQRTGVGEYTHELARALAALLPGDDTLTLFSSSWKDRLETGRVTGASVVDVRIPVQILNLAWHRLEWPPVELLAGTFDIAQSMHPLLMPARTAVRAVTIYDLFFLRDSAGTASEIQRDYPSLAARHACRADAVVVISNYTARAVTSELGVMPERIVLCPPGAPAWSPRPNPAPAGPILCLGSAERRKNLPGLLRAYARLRSRVTDAPGLILAGRAPDPGSEVMTMISQPGLAPHVRHLGYVSDDERQDLYRAASMLVVPSLDEGFGMPALEAMTVGVPVVAANRGALPEVVGDAGELVDPADDESIAEAMRRILKDPGVAEAAIERGYRRAGSYAWRSSASTLLDAYHRLHDRRSGQS